MNAKQNRKEHEALAPYAGEIRRFPPLGREEERALAMRARKGDAAAREKLVRHNLALVLAVVRRLSRGAVRLDDLVQEGNLGLLRAVEKFDPDAGVRFATYAAWWIRAYTWKYVKEARSAVRPKSGTAAQADLSLDAPIGDEQDDASFLERVEDEGPGPEETAAASEGDRRVRASLGHVRRRVGELGWDIIHNRLQRDHPETLEEIGNRWGISRERVRQVEVATKQFLRRYLEPVVEEETLPEAA
ncbi:MAG TPA: sigma-70 family RNA polymerase sigma factor [Anaeromyxobacteraceae bacterium]|nr:sigma-70 family RNA polymerase sigma factor [Anaeromyxobacteraceae bacterium]